MPSEFDSVPTGGDSGTVYPAAWPPHIHSGRYVERFHLAFGLAALPALLAGCVLFSFRALLIASLATASALAGQALCQAVSQRSAPGPARRGEWWHAAMLGLLFALTLPVTVSLPVPVVGGFVAVAIGKGLLGGLGNYVWHPALIGWAAVHLIFSGQVAPERHAFLARDHLLTGAIHRTAPERDFYGFAASRPPPGREAWLLPRPIDTLAACYDTREDRGVRPASLLQLVRDRLPPWADTVRGHVGGGLGETCVPAIALGGLLLLSGGYIRWHVPVTVFATVAVLAAVWPLQLPHAAAGAIPGPASGWPPVLRLEEGIPVGAAVVLFHLTGGGLWLAALLIATDPISTPLTDRGQWVFGIGVGLLTMVARCNNWAPGLPGGVYWAVLGMNTLVPLIDRCTRRRVFGTRGRVRRRAAISSRRTP